MSLAKVSLWPRCHSGQSVTGQTVSPAKLSLAKRSLWPNCQSGQTVLAKVSLAKVSFWPKCDSAPLIRSPLTLWKRFRNFQILKEACRQVHPQWTLSFRSRCCMVSFLTLTHNPEQFLEPLIRSRLTLWKSCKNFSHFISRFFLINILTTKIIFFR